MQTAQALIPVFTGAIHDEQAQLVDARTLHRFLGIDTDFRKWVARRIEEYGFQEGEDFRSFLGESSGGRRSREYHITLDMGKELAMVERNDKGRQARRYFIACEKRLQQIAPQEAATIRGQTIGTDGFHCLAAVLDGKLRLLKGGAKRAAKNHIWQQVHRAFSVVRAEDIPAEQLDSARNFIASYSVKEGEWLPKEEKRGGIYLDDYETHHLYLLMSRFAIMSEHRGNMLAAARALDSKPLWTIFGQIDEGRASFSSLDKRRDEIYSIYCKGGLRGGYAMTA